MPAASPSADAFDKFAATDGACVCGGRQAWQGKLRGACKLQTMLSARSLSAPQSRYSVASLSLSCPVCSCSYALSGVRLTLHRPFQEANHPPAQEGTVQQRLPRAMQQLPQTYVDRWLVSVCRIIRSPAPQLAHLLHAHQAETLWRAQTPQPPLQRQSAQQAGIPAPRRLRQTGS